jgi:hypothetical protein
MPLFDKTQARSKKSQPETRRVWPPPVNKKYSLGTLRELFPPTLFPLKRPESR